MKLRQFLRELKNDYPNGVTVVIYDKSSKIMRHFFHDNVIENCRYNVRSLLDKDVLKYTVDNDGFDEVLVNIDTVRDYADSDFFTNSEYRKLIM